MDIDFYLDYRQERRYDLPTKIVMGALWCLTLFLCYENIENIEGFFSPLKGFFSTLNGFCATLGTFLATPFAYLVNIELSTFIIAVIAVLFGLALAAWLTCIRCLEEGRWSASRFTLDAIIHISVLLVAMISAVAISVSS